MATKKENQKSTKKTSTPAKSKSTTKSAASAQSKSTAKSAASTKSKSATAKKTTKNASSPVLEKAKEMAGEILTGAATGAALTAINVVAEAVGDLLEGDGGGKTSSPKAKSAKTSASAKTKGSSPPKKGGGKTSKTTKSKGK